MRRMLPAAVQLLPLLVIGCLNAAASAARIYGPRVPQNSPADSYNATGRDYNSTEGGSSTACDGHNDSVSVCHATMGGRSTTVSSVIATEADLSVSAQAYNANSSAHNASAPQLPLPHQHLFPHGRKCGLEHISHSDKTAARAVRPHSGIAEGGISINIQVQRLGVTQQLCWGMQ